MSAQRLSGAGAGCSIKPLEYEIKESSIESSFDLYRKSHGNAVELLQEAELLFERGRFSRAYALAFTALEEISKSQLAADVHTGYITEQEFQKVFRDHRKKIERMAWATEDAKRYLTAPDGVYLELEKTTFVSRNDSMYVNLKDDKTIAPSDVIGREQAKPSFTP